MLEYLNKVMRAAAPAKAWVLAEDRFMSGWGGAKGKINVVVFPAASWQEAEWIERKLHNRPEMKRIRIVSHKPRPRSGVLYTMMHPSRSSFFYPKKGDLPEHLRSSHDGASARRRIRKSRNDRAFVG